MTRRLMLFLARTVEPPSLTRLAAASSVNRTEGAEYPIEWSQRWLLEGDSPTDEDDDALMEELFVWLRTLDGDLALVNSGWDEIVVRRGDRVTGFRAEQLRIAT
jgi:hypothetical protein